MPKSIHQESYQKLIQRLRDIRIGKNYSQEELAKLLNRNQTFVSKYERCEQRLDLVELVDICERLEVSVEEVVILVKSLSQKSRQSNAYQQSSKVVYGSDFVPEFTPEEEHFRKQVLQKIERHLIENVTEDPIAASAKLIEKLQGVLDCDSVIWVCMNSHYDMLGVRILGHENSILEDYVALKNFEETLPSRRTGVDGISNGAPEFDINGS